MSKCLAWSELSLGWEARWSRGRELCSTQIWRDEIALPHPARWKGHSLIGKHVAVNSKVKERNQAHLQRQGSLWAAGPPCPSFSLHFLLLALQPDFLPAAQFPSCSPTPSGFSSPAFARMCAPSPVQASLPCEGDPELPQGPGRSDQGIWMQIPLHRYVN